MKKTMIHIILLFVLIFGQFQVGDTFAVSDIIGKYIDTSIVEGVTEWRYRSVIEGGRVIWHNEVTFCFLNEIEITVIEGQIALTDVPTPYSRMITVIDTQSEVVIEIWFSNSGVFALYRTNVFLPYRAEFIEQGVCAEERWNNV